MPISPGTLRSLKDNTFKWRCFSRTAQVLVALIVLVLDIFVMVRWTKNQWAFNSDVGGTTGNTYVGGTAFTGIVLFTVRHLVTQTLILRSVSEI